MTKIIAFIFARGGSKGLKRKNVLEIGGLPLIAHSILLAKKIQRVQKVFVSTEDDEIKRIAYDFGAEVISRPRTLASDQAAELDAWKHAIRYLFDKGEIFDVFLSLPSTSPLRNECDINTCLDTLAEDTDLVITATPSSRNPFFNMVTRKENGDSKIVLSEANYAHRQESPDVFDITTVAYVSRPEFILNCKNIFEGIVKSVLVPKQRAVDIDDSLDFKIAKLLWEEAKLNER